MQPTRLLSAATAEAARYRTSRLARRTALAGAFAIVAITAACGGSDSAAGPSKPPQVTGAYPMATARGMSVPRTFTDAKGSKLTIEGGSLTVNADGTYALKYKGKLNALVFDLTDRGNYSVSGSTMSFTPSDGDPGFTGRVSGKSVSVVGFRIAGVGFDLGFSGN